MKQFTSKEQTAKLIELGFEKPKNERWVLDVANESTPSIQNMVKRQDYSIGELIEMLPQRIVDKRGFDAILQMTCYNGEWRVKYTGAYDIGLMIAHELIDALYYMLIDLLENDLIHIKSNGNTTDN